MLCYEIIVIAAQPEGVMFAVEAKYGQEWMLIISVINPLKGWEHVAILPKRM